MKIPIEDLEEKLRIKFDAWQKEFIAAKEPNLLLRCGRKSGKTEAMAAKAALDLLNEEIPNESHGILLMSKGQRQTKELYLKTLMYLQAMGIKLSKEIADIDENTGYATATQLIMPDTYARKKLYALSPGFDGTTLRTYSFWKIYRDEDAYQPDVVDTAIDACLAIYGVQEIRASTPCGTGGSFYDAEHSGNYRCWHVRTRDIIGRKPGIASWLLRQKKKMTRAEYQQEYEAEYTEMADSIYQKALIVSSMRECDWVALQNEICFIGVDFARFGDDENVIAFNFFKDGISHVRIEKIVSRFRTTHIVGAIMAATKKYNVRLVVTDEGGVGGGATDMLFEQLGKRKVLGIANQKRSEEEREAGRPGRYMKTDMHMNLIRMMENGKVILDEDTAIVRSLKSMRFKHNRTGDVTLFGHDSHAAEAIVRAVFPVKLKKSRPLILPTGSQTLYESGGIINPWEN